MKKYLFVFASVIFTFVSTASAHVGYVIEEEQFLGAFGNDWTFILSPLLNPLNLLLMAITPVIFLSLFFYLPKLKPVSLWLNELAKRADSYKLYIPLLIRQALGVLLIALGTQGTLISPVLQTSNMFALIEVVAGFMLILGIAIPLSFSLVFFLYFLGLSQDIYLFGNLEILGLSMAYLLLGDHNPSFDHLFSVPLLKISKNADQYAALCIRICLGLALVFLGFYEKLLNPHTSEVVANVYQLTEIIPVSAAMWVLSAGLIEIALGIAYILGLRVRLVSLITMAVLSMTFFFFKEDVSSHVTLFTAVLVTFILGSGTPSLDEKLFDKHLGDKSHRH